MQFDNEKEALDHLNKVWGKAWKIHQSHGEWVAERRSPLSDDEIRFGLEMSLVTADLQTLHNQIGQQGRRELEFARRPHPRDDS
jgi:hypothetical protein